MTKSTKKKQIMMPKKGFEKKQKRRRKKNWDVRKVTKNKFRNPTEI